MKNTFQKQFLESILERYPKKSEAVGALCSLLHIGKDAVYRRLRGYTILSADELALLAKTFNISIDSQLTNQTDSVVFSYHPFSSAISSFEDYFVNVAKDLGSLAQSSDVKLYYASTEIPIFYYFLYPELITFKLYIWGRTAWGFDYLEKKPFDFDVVPYPIIRQTDTLLDFYLAIPTVELLNINIINNTLSQIEYCVTSGSFANIDDAILLCDKLVAMLAHIEYMGMKGFKMPLNGKSNESGKSYDLFYNELVYTNNTILIKNKEEAKAVYTSFGNPNFLKSTDARICAYTEEWFLKIMSKSEVISVHGAKSRATYINRLSRQIKAVKSRIEMYIAGEV